MAGECGQAGGRAVGQRRTRAIFFPLPRGEDVDGRASRSRALARWRPAPAHARLPPLFRPNLTFFRVGNLAGRVATGDDRDWSSACSGFGLWFLVLSWLARTRTGFTC